MSCFHTSKGQGYNIKFSPFNPEYLALVSCENYGITGKGTLHILVIDSSGSIQEIETRIWTSGLFDVSWSNFTTNHILTCSGDGSLQLWDSNRKQNPVHIFSSHKAAVSSIDWTVKNVILSSSFDTTIKLWDVGTSTSLKTFSAHSGTVHEVSFAAHTFNLFASVSEDGQMRLWSTSNFNTVASFKTHDGVVLSCDWCKQDPNLIATCGSDMKWDIRKLTQPLFQLKGGDQAIRKIRFSPHFRNVLASVSFDHTTKIWDFKRDKYLEKFNHHSDAVYGIDFNSHKIDELADCSWDCIVRVFQPKHLKYLKNKI